MHLPLLQSSAGAKLRGGEQPGPAGAPPSVAGAQGMTAGAELAAKEDGFYTQGNRGQQRLSNRRVGVLNREQAGGEDREQGPATCYSNG